MGTRPAIPAKLKRRVLVEAGHRCAIPTCRFPTTELAHIVPYSEVLTHEYHNLIALCPNCHTRYDGGEIDRQSMKVYKQKIRFLSDRYSPFELNLLDHLRGNPRGIVHGVLMVKNLLDEGLVVNVHTLRHTEFSDGYLEITEFAAALTEKGQAFLHEWFDSGSGVLTYGSEDAEPDAASARGGM